MANRNFADDIKTIERKLIQLDGFLVTSGGAGAVDTTNTMFTGGTITRTGVGTYQLALQDEYKGLDAGMVNSAGNAMPTTAIRSLGLTLGYDGTSGNIVSVLPNVLPQSLVLTGTPVLTFQTLTNAPAVADSTRAITVYITAVLKNGSVV
jgi:hypothetical protein